MRFHLLVHVLKKIRKKYQVTHYIDRGILYRYNYIYSRLYSAQGIKLLKLNALVFALASLPTLSNGYAYDVICLFLCDISCLNLQFVLTLVSKLI